ncbi:BREX-3 system P-loop-containing protein BrxF [Accumulibacter sp.]|uniref:BREX-3 system P-loop-containing protein BrxF n=1 Tax=Accumulibacter sp. TaxID=2053492 RepID=UPI0025D5443F|nr:BREX-3 system P-loop-containing protein BrxF [Accumulibacter sp.]MCM8625487.1 BREX-3 system P-loop-containing protein BrxF [Accumulibacter sp.]
MLEQLDRLATDVGALHCKLILLVGAPGAGKTALLIAFGKRVAAEPINVGAELGRRLAAIPQRQRHLQTNTILRELADQHAVGDLLLLDNIELLFDRTLQLDPLDLLKRHAHARRVVAVWPGELRDGRLIYTEMGHPEHQDYGIEALVPFAIQ